MTRTPSSPGRLVDAARRFRARRRRAWLPVSLVLAAVVALCGAATWVVLGSSMFALRTVRVDGVTRVTVQQVLARAALPSGRSLLLIDPNAIARKVELLRPVARAEVTREWPHTLLIHVVERRPAAVVVSSHGGTLLDAHGVAFASAPTPPPGLVQIDVAGAVPGPGSAAAQAAMRVVRSLPPKLRAMVQQVHATSADDVSLALSGGRNVVWGSATDNAQKASVLQVLLHRHATHYDVSVPDVAVTG